MTGLLMVRLLIWLLIHIVCCLVYVSSRFFQKLCKRYGKGGGVSKTLLNAVKSHIATENNSVTVSHSVIALNCCPQLCVLAVVFYLCHIFIQCCVLVVCQLCVGDEAL